MARDDEVTIRMPLLAALRDEDPDTTVERPLGFKVQVERLEESVREDLQDLLNTRQRCLSWDPALAELSRSVFGYGVEDMTGANLATPQLRTAFLDRIGAVVEAQDPRFRSVVVTALDNSDPHDRTLRFRIEARLRVETGTEAAIFDFQMEPVSRRFR